MGLRSLTARTFDHAARRFCKGAAALGIAGAVLIGACTSTDQKLESAEAILEAAADAGLEAAAAELQAAGQSGDPVGAAIAAALELLQRESAARAARAAPPGE